MGLLTEGKPLSWEATKALSEHVRLHGVNQFVNLHRRCKDRQGDIHKWGDEIEYIIVKFDDANKVARVSLKAEQLLTILNEKEERDPNGVKSLWRPEYGAFMIEGTPGKPFGGSLSHINFVEANMRYRREEVTQLLEKDECVMSITNFPRLGAPEFTFPIYHPNTEDPESSLYFPDEAIFPAHPRYKTIERNIRMRRGEKVVSKMKVFKDEATQIPVDGSPMGEPDVVVLDAMGFGAGCCCLQLTFQATNITEARMLYDQMAPLCPIMLALTAASPIYRGYLTETDCRWNALSSTVDCRTEEERGLKPLKNNKFRIAKSRYDSIDSYLSPEGEKYNDVPLIYDDAVYKRLRDNGIDHLMAQHVAHLFIRDTVMLLCEKVDQNDEEESDHFENIQSTNWNTMRFKPPPPNSPIGWRVEFRPCEAQITDFENAAIECFVVLLTKIILSGQANFLTPISKVDENMKTAQKRDSCRKERFWFRKMAEKPEGMNGTMTNGHNGTSDHEDHLGDFERMTVNEIVNGKTGSFPGLVPLMRSYLESIEIDTDTNCTIERYLRFIQKRASGELLTTATWIREQVLNHPDYKKDSIVSDSINYDLLKKMQGVQQAIVIEPTLIGQANQMKIKEFIPATLQEHVARNG